MLYQAKKYLEEVEQNYPHLRLESCKDNLATYRGTIAFTANYKGCGLIDDVFKVEILFPLTNKGDIPIAKEIGGRIPRKHDFHVNDDGAMCLGAPLEVRRLYKQTPSLEAFINRLLIPFLYSFSFKEKYGYMPFGELSHGVKGVAEYYKELFGTNSNLAVLSLLKIIVEDHYRGHILCPCGSGHKLRNCHGQQIREIKEHQTREQFFSDFLACLKIFNDSGKQVPRQLVSKRMLNYWKKYSKTES